MGHPGPGVRGPSPLVPRPSDVQKGPKLSKFKIQNSKNNAKMGLGKKSNQQYGKAIQYCRAREPAWGGRRSTQTQPKSKIYVGSVCSRTRVTEPGVWCLMDCTTGTAPLGRTRVTEPKILDCSTGARIREELAEGCRRVDRSGVGNMCSVRYAVGAVWCLGLRAFCDHVFKHKTKLGTPLWTFF